MTPRFYEDLGLKPEATKSEIRSAYRKLVLQHHPDRSKDPASKAIFQKVREAYEVLSDPVAKARYDAQLESIKRRAQEDKEKREAAERRQAERAQVQAERKATPSGASVKEEVVRLQTLYGSGRHNEAEKLAYAIMQIDPRQAIPYAVLADILRGRGYVNEAGTMYAYAAQMDPTNPVYQRRYEQLLTNSRVVSKHGSMRLESEDKSTAGPVVGGGFVLLAGLYVALSPESAVASRFPFVSSWTSGMWVGLFLAGIATGAALAVGNLLDRFDSIASSTSGKASSTAILGLVALVNFWVSAVLYVLIALGLRAFNFSTTRLMLGVSATTLVLTLASIPSKAIQPSQTFLWGGNLVYLGGLVGWMVVDAMREGT